jgi:hypothetical protein
VRRWPFLGWRQQAKYMMSFLPRLARAACCAALSFLTVPALAQNPEQKPPEQQQNSQSGSGPEGIKNGHKVSELAEAAAALNGPAGNAECVWLGRRVVSLLWRDDLDTAFRHLDLYDRFGCPANHVQTTFRCVVSHGPFDSKIPDSLNSRVHACWINQEASNPPQDAPAATTGNPARR